MRKEQKRKERKRKRKKRRERGLTGAKPFVPVGNTTQYKCEAFVLGVSPSTNAPQHLYRMLCTSSIPGTI
jgi:hypothetical protein